MLKKLTRDDVYVLVVFTAWLLGTDEQAGGVAHRCLCAAYSGWDGSCQGVMLEAARISKACDHSWVELSPPIPI